MPKKNLNQKTIRLLRKVEAFLLEEPRRFSMRYGITKSANDAFMLEQPPCGTACCIGGAAYAVATGLNITKATSLLWSRIIDGASVASGVDLHEPIFKKLFFMKHLHTHENQSSWPEFYEDAYKAAKTPLQRACVGVARIEHFIATDGQE